MGMVKESNVKFEGTHKIQISNFGEDINKTFIDCTDDEYNFLKRVEYEMHNTRFGYCPNLVIEDVDQIAAEKKRIEEEKLAAKRRAHENYIMNHGMMAQALKKAGFK